MRMDEILALGPKGTFAHEAARRLNRVLGKELPVTFARTIPGVFRGLRGGMLLVVPLENSDAGSVGQTMDQLASVEGIRVIGEIDIPVHHHLCSRGPIESIRTIYCHPQTYAQCEAFLADTFPDAEVVETSSNAASAQRAAQDASGKAAIVPWIASEIYGVGILRERVENTANNTTRFIVIAREGDAHALGKPAKSSMIIDPRADRPGLLYEILGVFTSHDINLTKIESRPSKRELGDYIFYLEMESDASFLLDELGTLGSVRFLGAYANMGGSDE